MSEPVVMPNRSISVVLCTYNGGVYLIDQLQSLLAQTVQPGELLICDDGSSDDTVDIIDRFRLLATFPVRILVNSVNLGSTLNFDQALGLAEREYLALCDQDDIWFPDKLAALAKVLDDDPEVGGVFSDAVLMTSEGRPLDETLNSARPETLWSVHRFVERKQELMVNNGAIGVLLKHDVITGATFMVRASTRVLWHPIPGSWVHDAWIAWMLAVHSRLAVVARPLMAYRVHPQQQVGIGKTSLLKRLKQVRVTERSQYLRTAANFEILRDRIAIAKPSDMELRTLLEAKIYTLRHRAALSHSFFIRACQILAASASYRKYARGWRSMRKDLFLS